MEPPFQVYTWAFQSSNRDRNIFPEANDFTLPLQMTTQGPIVSALTVGSIEMEQTQWTVEKEWSELYFDEGLVPLRSDLSRTFHGVETLYGGVCMPVQAKLPLQTNKIVYFDEGFLTTELEHGLEGNMPGVWAEWGGSIDIITSTGMVISLHQHIVRDRITIEIPQHLYEFITLPAYIRSTSIPSPSRLACALSRSLYASGSQLVITYEKEKGAYVVRGNKPTELMTTGLGLAALIGLPSTSISVSDKGYVGQCTTPSLVAYLEPGQYTEATLQNELELALNAANIDEIVFEFVHPVTFVRERVKVQGGIWGDTNMLMAMVQNQLGQDSFVRIDFDCRERTFMFSSDRPFVIDFSVHPNTAFLFGFDAQEYAGQTFYRSPFPVRFGFALPRNKYTVEHIAKQNKYLYTVKPPRSIAIQSTRDLQITSSSVHGLAVGDVIRYQNFGSAVVTNVLAPDTFEVHLAPPAAVKEFQKDESPSLNFYLSKPQGSFAVHARYLGFPPCTIEMDGMMIVSPFIIDITPVKYVLFDIRTPDGNTRVETSSGTENRCVVGKIIMKPKIKLDRIDTMSLDVTGLKRINQVHIRILNPDFSLYHFHGTDWSGSLLLSTLQVAPLLMAN